MNLFINQVTGEIHDQPLDDSGKYLKFEIDHHLKANIFFSKLHIYKPTIDSKECVYFKILMKNIISTYYTDVMIQPKYFQKAKAFNIIQKVKM